MGKESSTISRRGFLKFAGKTAAVSAAFLSGCAQNCDAAGGKIRRRTRHAIDIHHHYFPPELIDEIKRNGQSARRHRILSSKASQRQSLSKFDFQRRNRLNPDPRMAEVKIASTVMTKGNIGIAMVEVHTASVGYELDGTAAKHGRSSITKRS